MTPHDTLVIIGLILVAFCIRLMRAIWDLQEQRWREH
jgi:hypothetical protein